MTTPNQQIIPPSRIKAVADLVFCIDATGSMAPCIEGVKNAVGKLVEGLQSDPQKPLDWRARVLGYRDFVCDEEPLIDHPFTNNLEVFRGQVSTLKADGGGDVDESTLDALYLAVTKSEWREANKAIVIFTDADSHSELFASNVEPGQARDIHEVINAMIALRPMVFLFGPKSSIYSELSKWERFIYKPCEATGLADQDYNNLMNFIGKTVSATSEVLKA